MQINYKHGRSVLHSFQVDICRPKQPDQGGLKFLYKAIRVLQGNKQEAYVYFDLDNIYACVATPELLRTLSNFAASTEDIVEGAEIFVEGANVTNAYLS